MMSKVRIRTTCAGLIVFLLGAACSFCAKDVYAQQNDAVYNDGTYYIESYIDADSNANLYMDSYMELEFDGYEDVDGLGILSYPEEDGQLIDSADGYGDNFTPAEVVWNSNGPVDKGHEYGLVTDGYACYDNGSESCGPFYYIGSAHAHINLQAPPPRIVSLSTYGVTQGDTGTLTVTGTDLVQNAADQLTVHLSGSAGPFSALGAPSANSVSFSYDFTSYPAGQYTLTVVNNEGESDGKRFTVSPRQPQYVPPSDPCAVTSSPQVGFTSIVPTGTAGGSGTIGVSFSGAAFAQVSLSITYGPYSTPSSIAASIAALITKDYYRYGLGAKAFGSTVIYSGNMTLGSVNSITTGSSFSTDTSAAASAAAENACRSAPPPSQSMYGVAYSAYIPVDHAYGPDFCTYYVSPSGIPYPAQLIYRGDGYRNTYRVTQAISLNFTASRASGYFADTGTTENYGFGSPFNGQSASLGAQDDDAIYLDERSSPAAGKADCYLRNAIGKAKTDGWQITSSLSGGQALTTMSGSSQNPLSFPFGSIAWKMTTYVDASSNTGYVVYSHKCYPAYQIKVGNTVVYSYPSPGDSQFSNSATYIVNCLLGANNKINGISSTKTIH